MTKVNGLVEKDGNERHLSNNFERSAGTDQKYVKLQSKAFTLVNALQLLMFTPETWGQNIPYSSMLSGASLAKMRERQIVRKGQISHMRFSELYQPADEASLVKEI